MVTSHCVIEETNSLRTSTGSFFAEVDHSFGQRFDHLVALLFLKFAEALLHPAFQFARGVGVGAVEIERERQRIAILQARAPAGRDDQGRAHVRSRAGPGWPATR